VESRNIRDFLDYINSGEFKIVGISVYTPNLRLVKLLVDFIKDRKCDRRFPYIVLGGHHLYHDPNLVFKLGADYGIVGEAETSFPYLIDALFKKSNDFNSLPGLIFRDPISGQIKRNPEQRLDLSANIFPAWHHIDIDYYSKVCNLPFYGVRSVMPVLSGRGCVGRCSFCSPSIGSFRVRPVEHVMREIEWLNSKYDFELINFINEMFCRSKEEIKHFCEALKQLNPRKNWICGLRADAGIDSETFLLMKESGCISTSAGIESGSDKVLKLMNKRTTTEQIKKFFRDAKTAGLPCNGTFLVGNEGETEADLKETIDMVINEEMNAGESLTNAYPGIPIYKNALTRGLISDEWDYDWVNRRHINISEISNENFWDRIISELRRYNTFLLSRFKAKNLSYKLPFGLFVKAAGICPDCEKPVSVTSRRSLLGLKAYCRVCFQPVIFNLYELNEFKAHFRHLCSVLQKANRLVISGVLKDAVSLLRYDYFGLNYDKSSFLPKGKSSVSP